MNSVRPSRTYSASSTRRSSRQAAELRARSASAAVAPLAFPALAPLLDGESSNGESGGRVKPPQPEQRVPEQADQDGGRQVRAKNVLRSLAGGRGRSERRAEAVLDPSQQRHQQQAAHGQADAEIARLRLGRGEKLVHRLRDDVRDEQPEADRDQLLRPALGSLRERARPREAPDHDHARHALDSRADAERLQSNRARRDAAEDADSALDRHPEQAEPGQKPRATCRLRPVGAATYRPLDERQLAGAHTRTSAARGCEARAASSNRSPAGVSAYMTIFPSRRERASPSVRSARK